MISSSSEKTPGHTLTGWAQPYESGRPRGPRYRSEVTELDSARQAVRETRYDSAGRTIVERIYVPPGKLAEERLFRSDGTLDQQSLIRYGDNDRKSETTVLTGRGDLLGRWICQYDEMGRLASETYWNARGEVEVEDRYEYLDGGKTVSKTRGNVAGWTYAYGDEGRLLSVRGGYYSADRAEDAVRKYDGSGLLSEKTEYSRPGEVSQVTTYTLS